MAVQCLLLARSVCERMGIGSSGRWHDHDLCVIMTATTITYTAVILPMVGSTKSHSSNALGVSDIASLIARRSKVGLISWRARRARDS